MYVTTAMKSFFDATAGVNSPIRHLVFGISQLQLLRYKYVKQVKITQQSLRRVINTINTNIANINPVVDAVTPITCLGTMVWFEQTIILFAIFLLYLWYQRLKTTCIALVSLTCVIASLTSTYGAARVINLIPLELLYWMKRKSTIETLPDKLEKPSGNDC